MLEIQVLDCNYSKHFHSSKKVIILTYMLIYCSSFGSSIEDEEESEGQEGYNHLLIFSRISAIAVLMGT
jgi:hypothetical protein